MGVGGGGATAEITPARIKDIKNFTSLMSAVDVDHVDRSNGLVRYSFFPSNDKWPFDLKW